MARGRYKRVFQTSPLKLCRMIALRRAGKTYPDLAREFQVDHSTVLHWCHKYKIPSETAGKAAHQAKLRAAEEKRLAIQARKDAEEVAKMHRMLVRTTGMYVDPYDGSSINSGKNYYEYQQLSKSKRKAQQQAKLATINANDGSAQKGTKNNRRAQSFWGHGAFFKPRKHLRGSAQQPGGGVRRRQAPFFGRRNVPAKG